MHRKSYPYGTRRSREWKEGVIRDLFQTWFVYSAFGWIALGLLVAIIAGLLIWWHPWGRAAEVAEEPTPPKVLGPGRIEWRGLVWVPEASCIQPTPEPEPTEMPGSTPTPEETWQPEFATNYSGFGYFGGWETATYTDKVGVRRGFIQLRIDFEGGGYELINASLGTFRTGLCRGIVDPETLFAEIEDFLRDREGDQVTLATDGEGGLIYIQLFGPGGRRTFSCQTVEPVEWPSPTLAPEAEITPYSGAAELLGWQVNHLDSTIILEIRDEKGNERNLAAPLGTARCPCTRTAGELALWLQEIEPQLEQGTLYIEINTDCGFSMMDLIIEREGKLEHNIFSCGQMIIGN